MAAELHTGGIQRGLLSRTAVDYVIYFPTIAITGLMGLVSVAVLSKTFSPATYGNYALALSTLLLASMVTSLWLRAAVMRLLPQYIARDQVRDFVGTLITMGTLVTVLATALYALSLLLLRTALDPELYKLLWLVGLGIPVITAFTVITAAHRILRRSVLFSVLNLVRVLGGFLVGLALVFMFGLGAAGMLLGLVLVVGVVVAVHAVQAMPKMATLVPRLRLSTAVIRDMLAYTLPIVGVNLAGSVLAVSDRYLVEGYLGSYSLGIYAVTYGVAEGGMRLIANTFLIASEPSIFRAWELHDPQTALRLLERLLRYYAVLAMPAAVGLSVLREDIVGFFTTSEYVTGSIVVSFVSAALLLHGYSLIVGTVFDATKRTLIPFGTFLAAGALNVLLNFLLLPRYGYEAAAWSTLVSYGALLGLNGLAACRIASFRMVDGSLWRIALASIGMGVFALLLRTWLGPSIPGIAAVVVLALIVYGALVMCTGAITPGERREIIIRTTNAALWGLRQLERRWIRSGI